MRYLLILLLVSALLWLPGNDGISAEAPLGAEGPREPAGLATVDGLAIATFAGTPAEIGAQVGALERGRVRSLLRIMALRSLPARIFRPRRVAALVAAIAPEHREELHALAAASGVGEAALDAANVLVDNQCSALVSPPSALQPLRVARNLDFFPASAVGGRTLLSIVRPAGRHAFASVGWPGGVGVVSGMNDAGVTACILLNHGDPHRGPGQPVCFRVREILERCASVDEAVACFAATPVASSQYVVIADAGSAVVVWQGADGVHVDHPVDGWLACANGRRDAQGPSDRRGRMLSSLATTLDPETVSAERMRQALTATYLTCLNAQAMLFVPATRSLELALGGMLHPAALSAWHRIDLDALFRGASAADAPVTRLDRVAALPHRVMFR